MRTHVSLTKQWDYSWQGLHGNLEALPVATKPVHALEHAEGSAGVPQAVCLRTGFRGGESISSTVGHIADDDIILVAGRRRIQDPAQAGEVAGGVHSQVRPVRRLPGG